MPILLAAAVLPAAVHAATPSPVRVEPISRTGVTTSGDPIRIPEGTDRMVTSKYTIAPGASLPVHKHPSPRYGYVLSGSIVVTNVETHRETTFHAGDMIVEDVGRWHEARNDGKEPVVLLVMDFLGSDGGNVVLRDEE